MCSVCWPSNPFKYCYERILGFLPAFPVPSLTTSVSLCKIWQLQIIYGSHKKSTFGFFPYLLPSWYFLFPKHCKPLFISRDPPNPPCPTPLLCLPDFCSDLLCSAPLRRTSWPQELLSWWSWCSSSCSLNIHCSFWILFVYLSPSLALGKILEGKTASYLPEYPQGLLSTDVQNTTHSNFCTCLVAGHWSTLSPIQLATFPTLTT